MIMKRHFKNPIVRKLNDSEFKDTSNAEDFNAIYGSLDDIGLELEDILQYLQDFDSEESAYLINKLSKVRKYMAGIAFRPGCYDSQGDYFGDNNSCVNYNGCCSSDGCSCQTHISCDVPTTGCYPGDCVITSE